MPAIVNGWRGWLLGILATIIATLIVNGIAFQRETREQLAHNSEQLSQLRDRAANIIKYFDERIKDQRMYTERELFQRDETIRRLEKRIEELEKRR